MTRWKAAFIHVCISATIAVIAFALFFGVWYPGAYFHAAGADELVLLLVGVDLAIGPLLTVIVFRNGKRGLRFDLATIGIVQSVALAYGCHVVLESRPIFLVAALDRFVLVSANEVSDEDLALASDPKFRTRSWTGPVLVGAVLPTDVQERNKLVFEAASGHDIQFRPKYYRPFESVVPTLRPHAQGIEKLEAKSAAAQTAVAAYLSSKERPENSVAWLPLQARKSDLSMMIDRASCMPLKAFPFDPW